MCCGWPQSLHQSYVDRTGAIIEYWVCGKGLVLIFCASGYTTLHKINGESLWPLTGEEEKSLPVTLAIRCHFPWSFSWELHISPQILTEKHNSFLYFSLEVFC